MGSVPSIVVLSLVKTCPECCSFNNDNAIFCSSCGIQLSILPVAPVEVTDRMRSLQHSVGELSQSNLTLQEQLQKAIGEIRVLSTRVESSEQAQRLSGEKISNLVKANEDLLQQVKQLSSKPSYVIRPRYCDGCGKLLPPTLGTGFSGYYCPHCGRYQQLIYR